MPRARTFGFGRVLQVLRQGRAAARTGWNGAGMFLYLVPGSTFRVTAGRPMAAFWPPGTETRYRDHIDLKTVDGSSVPWVASQTDLLATDWVAVVPVPPPSPRSSAHSPRRALVKVPTPKSTGPKGTAGGASAGKGGFTGGRGKAAPAPGKPAVKATTKKTPAVPSGGLPPMKVGAPPKPGKPAAPPKPPTPSGASAPPKAAAPKKPAAPSGPPTPPADALAALAAGQGPTLPVPPPGRRIPPGAVVPPSPLPQPVAPADMSQPNIGVPPT